MNAVLLSTAYLPNLDYFSAVLQNDLILIEAHENFQKQSYRNRCTILSANGKLDLSIPLVRTADKELIKNKKISYAENWQVRHWRGITSAYKNCPYFEYFEDEFTPFYTQQFEMLIDFNTELLKTILKILREKKEIRFTDTYNSTSSDLDLRELIHPKKAPVKSAFASYNQCFSDKFPFVQNLSVIDLLFNQGLNTKNYLL
jgi:hypothetical protein